MSEKNETKKRRSFLLALPFLIALAVLTVISFCIPLRPTISTSEKRELTKFPEFTLESLLSGDYFDDITLWFSDTFPGREDWLSLSQSVSSFHGYSEIAVQGDLTMSDEIPQADVYHSLSTGYAGILGSCVSYAMRRPFLLTEHGIYTREREEDIIRAQWVEEDFKEIWIDFFKKMSLIAYQQATVVTSLFQVNKTLQVELGCPEEKIRIIPNGVSVETFGELAAKRTGDPARFNIGAVLRVVPIKDVKTMILAFADVKDRVPAARLYIMGNCGENPEYYQECEELVQALDVQDVSFLGQVNVMEHLADMDLLLLSSISEGQPLAILEGMAAGLPFVATNVGDCRGLLEGENGEDPAGLIVPVMDSAAMADAIVYFYTHPKERLKMGQAGRRRVCERYRKEFFLKEYRALYNQLGEEQHGGDRV